MTSLKVAVAVSGTVDLEPWDLYELAMVTSVFGVPQPDLADPWYDLKLCSISEGAGDRGFGYGLHLAPTHGVAELLAADTVIVPSVSFDCVTGRLDVDPALTATLRRAHDGGARMVSLCDGAFALAAAGILDGKSATVHWSHTGNLAERYPKVHVDRMRLYTDDGNVLTSGGMTAGLDLCLHLVRRDLGASVANRLARRLVIPPHRSGGQAQYIDKSVPANDSDGLGPVLDWAKQNLDRPITVDQLAKRAGLSSRSFFRRLHDTTGTTPLRWLLNQRLAHAQTLLESTGQTIEQIARSCGLGSASNLRRHFTIHIGVSPVEYRRTFQGTEPPAVGVGGVRR